MTIFGKILADPFSMQDQVKTWEMFQESLICQLYHNEEGHCYKEEKVQETLGQVSNQKKPNPQDQELL